MRLWLVLILGCASAPPPSAPEAEPEPPEGSGAELIRGVAAPGSLAELDAQIDRLKALVRRSAKPGPLLLRLADAFMERAMAHGRAAAMAFEESVALRPDPAAVENARSRAERHRTERVEDLERARRVLDAVRPEWPEHDAAVETRFWLLAERREWREESLAAARAIIDGRSSGSLLAAAHLRLAEAAFEEASFDEALTHYGRVLATEGADVQTRAFASYKRAWVLYDLSRFADAERAFAEVLALAATADVGSALAREAAKDRLRVHVSLRSPPERVLEVIRASTDDPELRATLVTRHEQMLRDAGQLREAAAFRAFVLR